MGDQWKRWRVYMDEFEDQLRWVAQELDAAERDLSADTERFHWPDGQQRRRSLELARRMADMPFFSEFLRDLSGRELGAIEPAPDAGLAQRPVPVHDVRRPGPPIGHHSLWPPLPDAVPPRRLLTAERALRERTRSLVVVLDHLAVPRNASAVIRTSEALGLQELHFVHPRGFVVPQRAVTKRCERWIDLRQSRDSLSVIAGLKERGYRVVGADFGPTARPVEDIELTDRVAVVLGSEQEGVTPAVRDAVDELFFIPTVGMTAYLNVSVAAAISLATFDRRLREEGLRRPLPDDELRRLRAGWYRALARGRPAREAAYLRWLHRPPVPSGMDLTTPSREKHRQVAMGLGGRS